MNAIKNYTIKNAMPATCWQDATPLGNGKIGAMFYGSIYDERILLNHEALYSGSVDMPLPDISGKLKTLRKYLDDGDYLKAERFYPEELKSLGYSARTGDYLPAFDIRMITKTQNAFSDYSRRLNFREGVFSLTYKDGETQFNREAFTDSANGFLFIKLSSQGRALNFEITFEPHDLSDAVDSSGNAIRKHLPSYKFYTDNGVLKGELVTLGGDKFTASLKVFSNGKVSLYDKVKKQKLAGMRGTAELSTNFFSVSDASEALIVCSLIKSGDEKDFDFKAFDLSPENYEKIRYAHTKSFSADFDRMKLIIGQSEENRTVEQMLLDGYNGNIPASVIEKQALFGRYLLLSSSSNCKYPANLQGIWNGAYCPAWSCTFFNNENIEMSYWQALSGNIAECCLALYDFYLSKMEDYRENAKKLFGCRGILLPLYCDDKRGLKKDVQSHVLYWTASSSWISNMFFDYYLHTRDKEFLKQKAYPFMKESALFYEDFMQTDEKTGYLKSYPSDSPENCANGSFNGAGNVNVCINATMDFAALKQLLTDLLYAEKELAIQDEKHSVWQNMLEKIPPYAINSDGALAEWMHSDFKDNYEHRHLSHLYPLFPGREITKKDEKLFSACEKALMCRYKLGLKEQTGWSFAHLANLWAAAGNGEKALDCLNLLMRFCVGNNLFTYHNDCRSQGVTLKFMWAKHAPFQIDANLGFTAAVQNMLISSSESEICVFPALPKSWDNVYIGPCLTRAGVAVTAELSECKIFVTLKAKTDVQITLSSGLNVKWQSDTDVKLKANESLTIEGIVE